METCVWPRGVPLPPGTRILHGAATFLHVPSHFILFFKTFFFCNFLFYVDWCFAFMSVCVWCQILELQTIVSSHIGVGNWTQVSGRAVSFLNCWPLSLALKCISFLCVWVFCLLVCLWTMFMPGAHQGQKNIESPGPGVIGVSCNVDAGNWTWVFPKNKCSLPLSQLLAL